MSLAGAALTVALAAASPGAADDRPWELDYYRSRAVSGVACRYENGDRALLLRTAKGGEVAFVLKDAHKETVAPLELEASGDFRFEANGGLATYHAIRLAVWYLLQRPETPVTARTFDELLSGGAPEPCARKRFDADLYEVN